MVLTVQATEVTPCAGQRQTGGAWVEMVERLFLDGVDGQGTRSAIHLTDQLTLTVPATATEPRLPFCNYTVVGTDPTLNSAVIQLLIIPCCTHHHIILMYQRIHQIDDGAADDSDGKETHATPGGYDAYQEGYGA